MNRFVFYPSDYIHGATIQVPSLILMEVMGESACRVGAGFPVGEIGGRRGMGKVITVVEDRATIEIQWGDMSDALPGHLGISLIVGLCRPQMMKRILEFAASAGAESLFWVRTELGEKSYQTSKVLTEPVRRHHLRLGMAQGGSTWEPAVSIVDSVRKVLMPTFVSAQSLKLLADVQATANFIVSASQGQRQAHCTLAVGPERGWSERERNNFMDFGFLPFQLGTPQLRVESAVAVAVGQVLALRQSRGVVGSQESRSEE